jgi:hypothetical protein
MVYLKSFALALNGNYTIQRKVIPDIITFTDIGDDGQPYPDFIFLPDDDRYKLNIFGEYTIRYNYTSGETTFTKIGESEPELTISSNDDKYKLKNVSGNYNIEKKENQEIFTFTEEGKVIPEVIVLANDERLKTIKPDLMNMQPGQTIQGGKRKSRRNRKSNKSKKRKSRKNYRKSTRRR